MSDKRIKGTRSAWVLGVVAVGLVVTGVVIDTRHHAAPTRSRRAVLVSAQDAGLKPGRATFDDAETAQANQFAATFADQLREEHPELATMTLESLTPVFDEQSPAPIGAMARYVVAQPVPSVELDLVRLDHGKPDTVPSEVTNLRALEAIVLFATGEVVHVGISPRATDAADPATATAVRPLDGEGHRNQDFGGNE
jgi:hypothetical protein